MTLRRWIRTPDVPRRSPINHAQIRIKFWLPLLPLAPNLPISPNLPHLKHPMSSRPLGSNQRIPPLIVRSSVSFHADRSSEGCIGDLGETGETGETGDNKRVGEIRDASVSSHHTPHTHHTDYIRTNRHQGKIPTTIDDLYTYYHT